MKLIILRRIGKAPFGSDTYFYLSLTDQMRRNDHTIPLNADFLFGGTGKNWALPSLVPLLCSYVPRAWLDRNQALIPIGAKVAAVFALAFFTGWLCFHSGLSATSAAMAALTAGLLYALSPINWNANRANLSDFTFSPRAVATLFSVLAGLLALIAVALGDWLITGLAVGAVAGSILTAKFSAQVCAFILPLTALFTGESRYLEVAVGGFAAAILLSRGHIWRSLNTQIRHLAFYARKLVHENAPYRSPFGSLDVLRIPLFLIQWRWAELRALLMSNIMFRGLVLYPVHLALGAILLIDYAGHGSFVVGMNAVERHTVWLWIAALTVFLLTSLRPLHFLGEADRYLDYFGFAPATAILAIWLVSVPTPTGLAVLAALVAATAVIAARPLAQPPRQAHDPDLTAACAFLVAVGRRETRILTVPITLGFEVHYKTGLPCFFPLPLDESSRDLILRYPIPLMDLSAMRARFGVTHLLTARDIEQRELEVAAAVSGLQPMLDNSTYRVYALADRTSAQGLPSGEIKHA
ncbi:hypothetical protein ACO9S2_03075 [Nitrospira sp. NS4]|uniref:hypothetical protein n=1 Tax=Nitrospira sp. NS4 TaxID=3414498 RepID=UPI003C2FE1E2